MKQVTFYPPNIIPRTRLLVGDGKSWESGANETVHLDHNAFVKATLRVRVLSRLMPPTGYPTMQQNGTGGIKPSRSEMRDCPG